MLQGKIGASEERTTTELLTNQCAGFGIEKVGSDQHERCI